MPKNTLNKIIIKKEQKLQELKKTISIEALKEIIEENSTFLNFKEKIENNIDSNKISLIAEIKKASPSAGIILQAYNPVDIAKKYHENKATCLSVLTEEDFFQGNLMHLHKIKQKINLPILCKDFFIDPFQVHLAKSYGADAILIILAGVTEKMANQLYEDALKLIKVLFSLIFSFNDSIEVIFFSSFNFCSFFFIILFRVFSTILNRS